MMLKHTLLVTVLFACVLSIPAQTTVPDGFSVWTTNWDNGAPGAYFAVEWVYLAADEYWEAIEHQFVEPAIIGQAYDGSVYDMGMDLIMLPGSDTLSGIFTVSMGDDHFPSTGTEFQHRKLNADGNWEAVQDPLFTTPADVSPLGVDIYTVGGAVHIAWLEDNDADGPNSNMGDVFDQEFTVEADGTLSPVGEPELIFSEVLVWGDTHPGTGGFAGLGVCDYDGDGDQDILLGEMFYGDSPASSAVNLLEQTGPGVWADSLQEIFWSAPGKGSEGTTCCDIDGDGDLDVAKTTGDGDGNWNQVYWYEKVGDVLEARGMLIDLSYEGEPYLIGVGHVFGLYINEPAEITSVDGWMLQ